MNDYRKPFLERTAPLRNPATAYRRSDNPRKRRRQGEPLRSSEDVIVNAVRLGYEIADEQISKGQEFARRLRGASARAGAGDVGDLVDHGSRLMRQLALLLVEMAESTLNAPAVMRSIARGARDGEPPSDSPSRPAKPARPDSPSATPMLTIPVEVSSARPARVAVSFSEPPDDDVAIFPLYDRRGENALRVTLVPMPAGNTDDAPRARAHSRSADSRPSHFLRVEITPAQAEGEYRGYAIHTPTQRPVGVITVTIG